MSFFSVKDISAGYGKNLILRDLSFSMSQGCIMGILGANGSGKTTLIKAICGILAHKGVCLLEGTVLENMSSKETAKRVSYISQRSGVSIDISVLDVVLMGFNPQLGLLEHPTKAMQDAAVKALSEVGLAGRENNNYMHLSEGQKQLCILARTMVSESRLLLLDEPESALDFQHRYATLGKIRNWVDKKAGGAIITLHDPSLALNYCDKLMLLKDGQLLKILTPGEDALEEMEYALSEIYGSVSLRWCINRSGKKCLIMLKEEDL